jgi:hypothetical protein
VQKKHRLRPGIPGLLERDVQNSRGDLLEHGRVPWLAAPIVGL